MSGELTINLLDLTSCISDSVDLVSKQVASHHRQVACIARKISQEMGSGAEQQKKVQLAASLHDIGALSIKDRLDLLHFEAANPHEHAALGYHLLKMFEPFSEVASIIRMHHVPWNQGSGAEHNGIDVPEESHILHLADRIAISVRPGQEILSQTERIRDSIKERSGKKFKPEAVEAFLSLADKESFWFDTMSHATQAIPNQNTMGSTLEISMDEALRLTELFAHIIDFRSRFTATHSSGIAASSEALAQLAGFSPGDCRMMRMAGYLHDLGKLAIPDEILEKPGPLTTDEYRIIKKHPYLTFRLLERVKGLETINTWGALHHERLDGSGYPFHLSAKELSEGSRIMAVADVFTAITEHRPYREGMDGKKALQVLQKLVFASALDGEIVALAKDNYDEVNHIREKAQASALETYRGFAQDVRKSA